MDIIDNKDKGPDPEEEREEGKTFDIDPEKIKFEDDNEDDKNDKDDINDLINDIVNDIDKEHNNKTKRGRPSKKDIIENEIEKEKQIKVELLGQLELLNVIISKFTIPLNNLEKKNLINSIYKILKKYNKTEIYNIPFYDEINLLATILIIYVARKK